MSNLEIFSNQDFVKIFTSTNAHVVDFTLFDTIDALPHLGITLSIGPYSLVNSFLLLFRLLFKHVKEDRLLKTN